MKITKIKLNIIAIIFVMGLLISSCNNEKNSKFSGIFELSYADINIKHNNKKKYIIQVYDYLDSDKTKNGALKNDGHKALLYDRNDYSGLRNGNWKNQDGSLVKADTRLEGTLTVTCIAENENGRCNVKNVKFELSKSKDGRVIGSVSEFGEPGKDVLRKGETCDINYSIDVPEDWVEDDETNWRLDIYFDDNHSLW